MRRDKRGHELGRVGRLAARRGDDRLDLASAFLARGPREALGNASSILDLPRSDAPKRVDVVTESQVLAVAVKLTDAVAGDGRHEEPGGVRSDVDDPDDDRRVLTPSAD